VRVDDFGGVAVWLFFLIRLAVLFGVIAASLALVRRANARAGFVLLTRPNERQGIRFGITVTKKIGNAVVRNRMKRRFRELLRSALSTQGLLDHDHVLIGRAGGVERDFHLMAEELAKALERAREGRGDPSGGRRPRKGNRGGNRGGVNGGANGGAKSAAKSTGSLEENKR